MPAKSIPPAAPSPGEEGKRETNKKANRAQILEAAKNCFLKLGYDGVTIRDVVRRTGLASGTFYNYFSDKDTLFKAVLESRIAEVSVAMREVRLKANTVEGFIHAAYSALFSKIAEDPSFFRLVLRNEHAVRSSFEDTVMGIPMRLLKEDLQLFIDRGVFPPVDTELLASAFYGVGFELGRIVASAKRPDPEHYAAFATRLMTGGVNAFGISGAAAAGRNSRGVSVGGSLP